MPSPPRITVIGAGAMGCLYAALLSRQAPVTVIDPWAEQVEAIQRHGLTLVGISGEQRPGVVACHASQAARLEGTADIVFSLVNTNTTPVAAAIAAKVLSRDGFVVTLQNGIGNIEAYEQAVGPGRVIAGLSYHSAAVRGLALVEHTHKGPTWIGEIDGSRGERIRRLVALLEGAGAAPALVENIVSWVWTKFIHNCAINAVCAVAGLRVGEIPTTPGAEELQTKIIEECLAVVSAKGIVLADEAPLQSIRDFCRVKFNKPSMLQHLEANRETEIAALNGAVVRLGAGLGIPTPYNQAIDWMVKSVEHHRMFAAAHPDFDYAAAERSSRGNSQ